jgi:hypothetical protein
VTLTSGLQGHVIRHAGVGMNRLLTATLAFLLLTSHVRLFAKGETTRITIQGFHLKARIEIVNPLILSKFNVWVGPGTWSSEPGFNVNAPSFIADWSSGPGFGCPRYASVVRAPLWGPI